MAVLGTRVLGLGIQIRDRLQEGLLSVPSGLQETKEAQEGCLGQPLAFPGERETPSKAHWRGPGTLGPTSQSHYSGTTIFVLETRFGKPTDIGLRQFVIYNQC